MLISQDVTQLKDLVTKHRRALHQIPELGGSFTVELKYFRSMPWYKAIFLSNFFNFILVLSTYFMVK